MPTSITYPNGQVATSTALTDIQLSELIQTLTCGLLGINPPDYSKVRVNWQAQGQPFQDEPEQVMYIQAVTSDTSYTSIRNTVKAEVDNLSVTTITYTRNWRVSWVSYGPSAVDQMRAVHSGTFTDYFNFALNQNNVYPVSDPPEPSRVPEVINGQWFNRTDFYLEVYEGVTETITTPLVKSVGLGVYTDQTLEANPVADITIQNSNEG